MDRITLEAPHGMLYTNGIVYGSVIHLAEGMDGADFYTVTYDEYQNILDEQNEQAQEHNI